MGPSSLESGSVMSTACHISPCHETRASCPPEKYLTVPGCNALGTMEIHPSAWAENFLIISKASWGAQDICESNTVRVENSIEGPSNNEMLCSALVTWTVLTHPKHPTMAATEWILDRMDRIRGLHGSVFFPCVELVWGIQKPIHVGPDGPTEHPNSFLKGTERWPREKFQDCDHAVGLKLRNAIWSWSWDHRSRSSLDDSNLIAIVPYYTPWIFFNWHWAAQQDPGMANAPSLFWVPSLVPTGHSDAAIHRTRRAKCCVLYVYTVYIYI